MRVCSRRTELDLQSIVMEVWGGGAVSDPQKGCMKNEHDNSAINKHTRTHTRWVCVFSCLRAQIVQLVSEL